MTSELKIDLRDFGYAEGMYMGKCRVCSEQFMGAKRSWSCKTCAEVKSLDPRQPRAVPDVPELVRYDLNWLSSSMVSNFDGHYVRYDQAAEIFAAKDKEIEQAKKEINTLLVSYVREHFFENKTFQPLDSLIGQISQLDNAITITRDFKSRAEAAEAKLAQYEEETKA